MPNRAARQRALLFTRGAVLQWLIAQRPAARANNAPCEEVAPSGNTVYSTYSEVLTAQYGFQVMTCPSPTHTADCMDGKCTLTGKTVTLTDTNGQQQQIPTAICQCTIETPGGGGTLGGQCNEHNCSAVWSTAGSVLDSQPPCNDAEGTDSR